MLLISYYLAKNDSKFCVFKKSNFMIVSEMCPFRYEKSITEKEEKSEYLKKYLAIRCSVFGQPNIQQKSQIPNNS